MSGSGKNKKETNDYGNQQVQGTLLHFSVSAGSGEYRVPVPSVSLVKIGRLTMISY